MKSTTFIFLFAAGVFVFLAMLSLFVFLVGIFVQRNELISRAKRFCNVMLSGAAVSTGLTILSLF
ncbi:MAG: hypothetical protein E7260_09585 [Lachnospiraceae bacterium]|nr:hypothetical protein [Lachnospiraceae bacterium]